MTPQRHFVKFLKENKIFAEFYLERTEYINKIKNISSEEYLRPIPFENGDDRRMIKRAIIRAFDWTSSKRGVNYWINVEEKWLEYCDEHFKINGETY